MKWWQDFAAEAIYPRDSGIEVWKVRVGALTLRVQGSGEVWKGWAGQLSRREGVPLKAKTQEEAQKELVRMVRSFISRVKVDLEELDREEGE